MNNSKYEYDEPCYEEVAHSEDPFCSVAPDDYESFLDGFHYAMRTAEEFLRTHFEIEEIELRKVLNEYREHMIELTWMGLREDPECDILWMYRAGVLDAKLLPAKEGERFYEESESTLKHYSDNNRK